MAPPCPWQACVLERDRLHLELLEDDEVTTLGV
jgi:hypothetical protein